MNDDRPDGPNSRPLAVRPDQQPGSPVFTCVTDEERMAATGCVTVVGSVAGLRSLRRTLASWLVDFGIDVAAFTADVQLAVVEVVTNSFVHGNAEDVTVTLRVEQREVVITTAHRSAHANTVLPALEAPNTSVSGRGLFIVDQVVRERSVSHAGGTNTTTLFVPVPPETMPAMSLVATGTDA